MKYSDQKTEARLIAANLAANQTAYVDCPACGGHRKFSVTRRPAGVIWNCFKLECDVKGSTIEHAALQPAPARGTKLKPYTGAIYNPDVRDCAYFYERFGLEGIGDCIAVSVDDRYIFPVQNYLGHISGYVLREPVWSGIECPRKGTGRGPKAVLYMHSDAPTQSWYRSKYAGPKIVLVEDQLSAMKVAQQTETTAVALLGTQLDARKVREISQYRPDEVIIALDEDATDQAFKLARKWGLAFSKVRVAILEQDLKDTDNDDILEVLGL